MTYPIKETVGTKIPLQRLKYAQQERGISGYAICKSTGMPISTFSGYTTGVRKLENMAASNFVCLCQALNVPGEYFFEPDEKEAMRMFGVGNIWQLKGTNKKEK